MSPPKFSCFMVTRRRRCADTVLLFMQLRWEGCSTKSNQARRKHLTFHGKDVFTWEPSKTGKQLYEP